MSDTPKKFYLTTPIYYVNARPHIGHAYTTIVADVIARRHRLLGEDTFFLTGTDEHGQKIERSAIAAGIPPQQFADGVSKSFRDLWTRMGILDDSLSQDDPLLHRDFIRTTDPRHKQGVQRLFKLLQDRGHIYLSTYTGQYCVSDEAYVDGPPGIRCPDCGRTTETVSESNYYFRLSAFQLPLLNLIEAGPNGEPAQLRITPESRRNEVLSFLRGNVNISATPVSTQSSGAPSMAQPHSDMGGNVESSPAADPTATLASVISTEAQSAQGRDPRISPEAATSPEQRPLPHTAAGTPYVPGALKDLSISRTSFHWGVPVPGDEAHVIYVWLDALANYMTAIGYGSDDPADIASFERFWPADLHLVGKEIIRFHCIYWPAFLLALNPEYSAQPATEPATKQGAPEPALGLPKGLDSETWVPPEPQTTEPPPLSPEDHRAWAEKMLPKAITAHGWLLFQDSGNEATKMSKSKGNIVRTETILDAFGPLCPPPSSAPDSASLKGTASAVPQSTPAETPALAAEVRSPLKQQQDLFASDVLRYFLLREIPFGQDGSFSFDALITRYNADLANGYGNLVSRTLSMIEKYRLAEVPAPPSIDRSDLHSSSVLTGEIAYLLGARSVLADLGVRPVDRQGLQKSIGVPSTPPVASQAQEALAELDFGRALERVLAFVSGVDGFITAAAPWRLAKLGGREDQLSGILYTAAESIRIITALLYPILPYATAQVWSQLGLGSIEQAARDGKLKDLQWGGLEPGTRLGPLSPIFPRAEKGLAQIMANIEQNKEQNTEQKQDQTATPAPSKLTNETTTSARPTPTSGTAPDAGPRTGSLTEPDPIAQVAGSASPATQLHKPPSHTEAYVSGPFTTAASIQPISAAAPVPTDPPSAAAVEQTSAQITIDDFAKVELRVARILIAERIPKADKLLRLEVDLGAERRQILSGIAEWYTPEDLVGRKIVVITNLAPRKMRGLLSHGMLLAASSGVDGKPALATFADSDNIEVGARLK